MGKIYRVLVVEQDDSRPSFDSYGGAVPQARVLFEAASPDAGRLVAYAPDEVADALTAAGYAEVPQRVVTGFDGVGGALVAKAAPEANLIPDAVRETLAEPSAQTVDEPVSPAQPAAPAPKRKRRTKAEIEADKAAALASQAGADPGPASEAAIAEAASEVREQIDVSSGLGPNPGVPATVPGLAVTTTFAGAAPVPPAEPVTPALVGDGRGGDSQPWNPFLQK